MTDGSLLLDSDGGYVWEQSLARPWDSLVESIDGTLVGTKPAPALAKQRQRQRKKTLQHDAAIERAVEKGMLRFMEVIIDLGKESDRTDVRPNRRRAMVDVVHDFIERYFEENPIAQLGIIAMHNKNAERITEMSGNPKQQQTQVRAYAEKKGGGEMSIMNALLVANETLKRIPPYGSREIVIIHSALYSVDPGDLRETIEVLAKNRITINVISLAAELHVLAQAAKITNGSYYVVLNKEHFRKSMMSHVLPSPLLKERQATVQRKWIRMGFPRLLISTHPSMCACHEQLKHNRYLCPKCHIQFCELPTECVVCGTTLVLSPHLARTYHHLFPVPDFEEDTREKDNEWMAVCFACQTSLDSASNIILRCLDCNNNFCIDCDEYIHLSLHNCPGCLSVALTDNTATMTASSEADSKSQNINPS